MDRRQEALKGKPCQYATLGCGEEVPLGVEELCGHSYETIEQSGVYGFFTPQVTLSPQIWGLFGR